MKQADEVQAPMFFVSRRSVQPDMEWAERVVEVIMGLGFSMLSQRDFPVGGDWGEWMRKGSACPYTVAIVSKAYFGSQQCDREWYAARVQERLIPFRIEPVELPEGETRVLYVDVFGMSVDEARGRIAVTIENRIPMDGRDNPPWWRKRGYWLGVVACFLVALALGARIVLHPSSGQVPARNYAYALGQSVATLGLDAHGSPEAMFDLSLQELGFPATQRDTLAREFAMLDREALRQGDLKRTESARAALEERVLGQFRTLFSADLAVYAELGAKCARLQLVLRHWASYAPALAKAESDRLLREMRQLLARVRLPEDVGTQQLTSEPPQWDDAASRRGLLRALQELQQRFDAEPLRERGRQG